MIVLKENLPYHYAQSCPPHITQSFQCAFTGARTGASKNFHASGKTLRGLASRLMFPNAWRTARSRRPALAAASKGGDALSVVFLPSIARIAKLYNTIVSCFSSW